MPELSLSEENVLSAAAKRDFRVSLALSGYTLCELDNGCVEKRPSNFCADSEKVREIWTVPLLCRA